MNTFFNITFFEIGFKILQIFIITFFTFLIAKKIINVYKNSQTVLYLNLYNTLEQYALEAYTIYRISETDISKIQENLDEEFETFKRICYDLIPLQYKKFLLWFSGDITILENRLYSYFLKYLLSDNIIKFK